MFAMNIGRTFLRAYNRKYVKNYSAQEFFEREFFPLFYDHPKYMQWVHNSPFFQVSNRDKLDASKRRSALEKLQHRIDLNEIDGSTAVGFPSMDVLGDASGQITNLDLPVSKEDVYASWIGGALGLGVSGGFVILFYVPELLLKVYEGWQFYRKYLEEIPQLKPNQIERWNGHWIAHVLNKNYIAKASLSGLNPFKTEDDGTVQIDYQKWVKVLAGIAQNFPNQTITGYVYRLDKKNITIGFVPFQLPEIKRPLEYYIKLFGENDFLQNAKRVEDLLGTEFGLKKSCEMGQIGIKAMQPRGLMPFIKLKRGELKLPRYKKVPRLKIKKNESAEEFETRQKKDFEKYNQQLVTFKTYEGWIMATLDDESLYEKAEKYAQCFLKYESGAGKGRTNRANHVKQALQAKNRRLFIDHLTTIIEEQKMEEINELVKEVDKMPVDNFNFQYFLTLIRFRYAYLNQN